MALKFHKNYRILAFLLALLFTQNIIYTAFAVSGERKGDGSFINPNRSPTTSGGYYYHGNTITIDGNLGFVLFGIIVGIGLLIVYLNRPRVLNIQMVRRWSLKAVEKEFRQLSTDERVKYDIESLVNVGNMKVQRSIIPRDNGVENFEKNYIVAVEVLWSPQVEHDTLSEDELLENYPLLRPI